METPLSSRRITRSQAQAMAAENNNTIPISSKRENEESQKGVLKSRQREKSALIDITNGSPIVGLAMGSFKTPLTCSKNRIMIENNKSKTPGSGESLLRGQVKTLLQKVEEEAVISKISFEHKPMIHKNEGFVNSPMAVLAPTPANTPQVGFESFTVSPVAENFNFSQMLNEIINAPNPQEHNDETARSLFMDFSDSSDCNSALTHQGCENKSFSADSDASVWSTQVNASLSDEYKHEDDEDYEENYEDDEGLDELCEEMSKITVNNGAKFTGKHIRFVYNSDGELEGEEEEGLLTPKGKHLRFQEESEEERE